MFRSKKPGLRPDRAEMARQERVYQARQRRLAEERNQVPACGRCGHPLFRGRCPEGHR